MNAVVGLRVARFASETVVKAAPGAFRVVLAAWIGAVLSQEAIAPGIDGHPDAFTVMEAVCVVIITLAMAFGGRRRT